MESTPKETCGVVKFYSSEKGYGFISTKTSPDVFFHITDVLGPSPPNVGAGVRFRTEPNRKREGLIARHVAIEPTKTASNNSRQSNAVLKGFPCIRGDAITGFRVDRTLGKVVAYKKGLFSYNYETANDARMALIARARKMGANAIINYYWHKEREKHEGFFVDSWEDYFWAEGVAVILIPEE